MSTGRSLSAILLTKEKPVHVLCKDPLPLGRRPTTAILIRAKSVVQVHPAHRSNHQYIRDIRGHSHPFGEYLSKNQFANYLPTLGLARWHYTQGVKTLGGEGRTAGMRFGSENTGTSDWPRPQNQLDSPCSNFQESRHE
jgi:hypothetical protein